MTRHDLESLICESVGADVVTSWDSVQTLWSGYGHIWRVGLRGGRQPSVIVKLVQPPVVADQPRGWNTDRSHARKLRSYEVEAAWYRDWAGRLDDDCRIATCHKVVTQENEFIFVLEDLNASGFAARHSSLPIAGAKEVLGWLARFHARFMQAEPTGLWPIGTYWHLETRPDEWAAMPPNDPLRIHAQAIDDRLNKCRFRTIVHGDAKIANFCFGKHPSEIAAVDFQYVGGGCGMKDVVYFLGSCLTETQCERHEEELLDHYFVALETTLPPFVCAAELRTEWRLLHCFAWADFNRFLIGWYPQHHKLHRYSKRMTALALATL